MFKSARIKLTAWYLILIMTITLSFSAFIFIGVEINTRHALEGQRRRFERFIPSPDNILRIPADFPMIDTETIIEIREQTLINLIAVNFFIFFAAGYLGYFLAGQTLKPIEDMVKKQKRFISDAAHELRTPLTAMKTGLEVTLRDKKLTTEESKETLKSTIEEVDKLHKFTTELLNQSKYLNGNSESIEVIKVEESIKQVIATLKPLADAKQQTLESTLHNAQIKASKTEISELITNLVENAIKFGNKSSVIKVSLENLNNKAIITIEDTGKGISKEDLPLIFDPFYKANKARNDSQHEGFGLGLAISKEIVERYKGTISAESEVNVGSKFTVKFPLFVS